MFSRSIIRNDTKRLEMLIVMHICLFLMPYDSGYKSLGDSETISPERVFFSTFKWMVHLIFFSFSYHNFFLNDLWKTGTSKTWTRTLKNLDPETPGPWITWNKYEIKKLSDFRKSWFKNIMRNMFCCLKVHRYLTKFSRLKIVLIITQL